MENSLLKSFLGDIPNLFNKKNPYKDYKKLREKTPLYRISPMRWMIMKYEDAVSLMQNPSVSHWGQDTETQNALFGNKKV
ncbi:hypothetical protein [Chryseobacterium sp. 3008163]|uniref:hypothetical protein n=1 Tax=Chryseobacterium sp. 3008163 TaxID=2478663 RepID=UPI000F0CD5AA|nr:hypothetical protein [Chryseobacterium sp. 3008163]AYN00852.1 hypothetical protein EAG08_11495 [Chryseobacterium sp. 3008163]